MDENPSDAQIRAARSLTGESQKALAGRANVTESVLKLLESPSRKRPDSLNLRNVKLALEAQGIVFLGATDDIGEGVRYAKPGDKMRVTTDFFRHARALLDFSIDHMASVSGVGRTTIGGIERRKFKNPPEDSVKKLRAVFYQCGVTFLPEETDTGGGVRFSKPNYAR